MPGRCGHYFSMLALQVRGEWKQMTTCAVDTYGKSVHAWIVIMMNIQPLGNTLLDGHLSIIRGGGGRLTILHHAGHYGYVPKTQFRFHPPPRDVCRGQELNLGFRVGSAVLEPPSHCSAPQFKGQRSREVLCVTGRWKLCAPWLSVVSRQHSARVNFLSY